MKIKLSISPRSVLNISSNPGFLVEILRDISIEAYGLNISENDTPKLRDKTNPYHIIGSDSSPSLISKYDLITCIGALEHLPEEVGLKAIQKMIQYSDTILLSPSPDDFEDQADINVQPPGYWVSIFGKFGYALDISYDASFISPHAILFRKRKYLDFSLLSRPLHICILSPNTNDALAQIRLCRPLSFLEKQGKAMVRIFPASKKHPPSFDNVDWADLIILQRIKSSFWKPYLKRAKKNKTPVIYEIDDNLLEIPPKHPQYSHWKKIKNNPKYSWYLRNADGITTTTRPLASYLKRYNNTIFLLPNYIDSALSPRQGLQKSNSDNNEKAFTIGFAGTITHSYDFEPICSALKKINELFFNKIRFSFLGFAPSKLLKETNFLFDVRNLPYSYYLDNIYRKKIDIGLAPLVDNLFNQCKSSIKFLEYTSVGIPGIYSKVGPYKDTIKNGVTGILVEKNNHEQWFETLRYLLENPESLDEIKFNAQKYVGSSYMLKDHYREWWDTYLHLLINIRGNLE